MSDNYIALDANFYIQSGFAFPSTAFVDDGIPIVRMSDLKTGKLKFVNTKYVGLNWLNTASLFKLKEDDFVMGMSGSLSNYASVTKSDIPALLNQRVGRLISKNPLNNYKYATYWLKSEFYHSYAEIQGEGAAQKNISAKQIGAFKVRNIGRKEQDKIVIVLSCIDESIEKTEALIEKYQQIKSGLMQDLLTRGIGVDGKLRPTRKEAPELYHETDLGWLPIGWDCDTLESVLAAVPNNLRSGPFGSALLKSELVEEGIPFLGIDNIHTENFVVAYKRFVSERKFNELNKYAVRPKDVVITIMGTVGRCAVVPDDIDRALSSKHLWAMTLDQERVIPVLICWQLNFASWVKSWFRRETQGGIMDAIQSKTLKNLNIPIPPIDEQKEIFKRYSVITNKIVFEQDNLDKNKKIKAGLMHDLLTGNKPVSIDESEVKNV